MSHVVRARFDPESVPSDASDRIETWASQYRAILGDLDRGFRVRSDATGREMYGEVVRRFDIRDDLRAIVDDLVATFDGVGGWKLIEARQDDREWDDATFADDPEYYPPSVTTGHRTPPALDRDGLFEVSAGAANYLIDGVEYSVPDTTITVPAAEGSPRQDFVVADTDATTELVSDTDRASLPSDVVVLGALEVHPGKVVVLTTESVSVPTSEWSTEYSEGDVPAPLTGGPDPQLTITGDDSVLNDGSDEAIIEIDTEAVASHEATLSIDGDAFVVTLDPSTTHTETISSTADAGYLIEVTVEGPWPTEASEHTIEVTA